MSEVTEPPGDRYSDVRADYGEVGFGSHLRFGERPAVVVVDMVRAYLDVDGPLHHRNYDGLAARTQRFLDDVRLFDIPVFFTCVRYRPDLADGGLFVKKVPTLAVFTEGSVFGDFHSDLTPSVRDRIITKHYASAFFGTALSSELHCLGVDTLVICGVSISGCVRASALDALQYGFAPFVVEDLVGDRDVEIAEANLFDLSQKYAEVVTSSSVLKALAERRSEPFESTVIGEE